MNTTQLKKLMLGCLLVLLGLLIPVAVMPASSFAFSEEPTEVKLHVRGTPILYPASDDPKDDWKEFKTITTDTSATFGDIKSSLPAPLNFDGYAFLGYYKDHGAFPWVDSDQFENSDYNVDYAYQTRFIQKYELQGATNAQDPAFDTFTQMEFWGSGAKPKVTPVKSYNDPDRDDAQFIGWFEDSKGEKPYDFSKRLNDYWEEQGEKYENNWPNKHFSDHPYKVYAPILTYAVFNEAPLITVQDMTINRGDDFDPLSMVVRAQDQEDGDLKELQKVTFSGSYNTDVEGVYELVFTATDTQGLKHKAKAILTVKGLESPTPQPEPEPSNPSQPGSSPAPIPGTTPTFPLPNLDVKPYDPSSFEGCSQSCQTDNMCSISFVNSECAKSLPKTADENRLSGIVVGFFSLILLAFGYHHVSRRHSR